LIYAPSHSDNDSMINNQPDQRGPFSDPLSARMHAGTGTLKIFECALLSESDNPPIPIRFAAVASVAGQEPLRHRAWNSLTIESDASGFVSHFDGQRRQTVRGPRVAADYKWDVSQLRTFFVSEPLTPRSVGKCWPARGCAGCGQSRRLGRCDMTRPQTLVAGMVGPTFLSVIASGTPRADRHPDEFAEYRSLRQTRMSVLPVNAQGVGIGWGDRAADI
jgi:hypothetical protein